MNTSSESIVNNAAEYFYQLTPEKILTAVEKLEVRCTGRSLALNSMENRVYEVEIELATSPQSRSRYDAFRVAKFYRPGRWSKEQILEEHEFLRNAAAEELAVVPPLAFPDRNTLAKLEGTEIYYAVFPKVGGRINDELTKEELQRLGRLIARLHSVGASHRAQHRLELTPENFGRSQLKYLLERNQLPQNITGHFSDLVNQICGTAENWWQGVSSQRIHGDLHRGNVLWADSQCTLVDFDDFMRGPCVQDLWLILPGRDAETFAMREILLKAYEEMRTFDRETLRLIEPLRALRIINFSAWIARRWEDPSFQRTFTEFGTDRFWRDQLVALQEVWQLMQGAEL